MTDAVTTVNDSGRLLINTSDHYTEIPIFTGGGIQKSFSRIEPDNRLIIDYVANQNYILQPVKHGRYRLTIY